MDRDGQHIRQPEFVDISCVVKCEVEEEEYLDEYRQEIAPAVSHDAYQEELPKLRSLPEPFQAWDQEDLPMPQLEPRPGLLGMSIKAELESSPMPEVERRPGLPAMPTHVRALEVEQSLVPTMPEVERRPALSAMPTLVRALEAVSHVAYQEELPKLRSRPDPLEVWDQEDLPMPQLERRPGLPAMPTHVRALEVEQSLVPTMPQLERRPGLPAIPTHVRALEVEPRPAQDGQSLVPTMPEVERRPGLPAMPTHVRALEVEPRPVQEGQPLVPTMPVLDRRPRLPAFQTLVNGLKAEPRPAQEGQSLVPTMPEVERRPGLPAMPTHVRALEVEPRPVQDGQPLVPTMPMLDRRPRLPAFQTLVNGLEVEPRPTQEGQPLVPTMLPWRHAPMAETEHQPGQLDVPIPGAVPESGSPLAQIQVPGLEAPVEIRLVSIEALEYWPQEILTPEEITGAVQQLQPGLNPQPELNPQPVPKRQPKRQPVQFVGQNDQPGHSRTGKRRPASPYPRTRSAVSSRSSQAGPSQLVPWPSAPSTSRQIAAQPQPSTSGKRPQMNGRITLDRAYVARVSGIKKNNMRSFPPHVQFVLDERSTLQLVYRCSACDIEFTDLKSYNNHSRIEHARVFCPGCHRTLMMGSLDRHLKVCPAIVCICRHCPYVTARPCELQQHLREVHQLPGERCAAAFCHFCNRGR